MKYFEYYPKLPLSLYVKKLWYLDAQPIYRWEKMLPTTSTFFIINLGSHYRLYKTADAEKFEVHRDFWLAGINSQIMQLEALGETHNMGAEMYPVGVYKFFGIPTFEMENRVVEADLIYRDVRSLREKIIEAVNVEKKFELLENYLFELYQKSNLVDGLEKKLFSEKDFFSQRYFIEKFKQFYGTTPKTYQRIERLNRTLQIIGKWERTNWSDIVFELEFYDQPHLIHEFKSLTGFTPSEYFKIIKTQPDYQNSNFVGLK